MATSIWRDDALHLSFSWWEAIMVRRSAMEVPLPEISSVEVLPGWTSEILGIRSGLVISGYLKVGTFRHPRGTRRLVAMKRGYPVLRIGVRRAGTGFDELLLSSPHAYALAKAVDPAGAH